MSKLLLLLVIGTIVLAIMSDVLEVNFRPENYKNMSNIALSLVKNKSVIEKGKAAAVAGKRWVELKLIQNKERRMVLALLYVKTDAERVMELTRQGADPATILPRTQLLTASIERVRAQANDTPAEIVAKMKEVSEQNFALAKEAVIGLLDRYEPLDEIPASLARIGELFQTAPAGSSAWNLVNTKELIQNQP